MLTVNAMGENCPIPVIKTKKAMQELTGPEVIEVLVDNEIAVQNVTKMAASPQAEKYLRKTGGKRIQGCDPDEWRYGSRTQEEDSACIPDQKGNMVVVESSDRMGIWK